jgi:hypothetical protein
MLSSHRKHNDDAPGRGVGGRDAGSADERARMCVGVFMRSIYEARATEVCQIEGRLLSGSDKIVPPPKFGDVCRVLWPYKTAAHLASIAGREERTAKRWLSGEFEPPICIVFAVLQKMFERDRSK